MPGNNKSGTHDEQVFPTGETGREVAERLTLNLARTSKSNSGFFHSNPGYTQKAALLRADVVGGNLESVRRLVTDDPGLLFEKGPVSLHKEYVPCLMRKDEVIKPNHLYFARHNDGSLQYTVETIPGKAPITAMITADELAELRIDTLSLFTEPTLTRIPTNRDDGSNETLQRLLNLIEKRGHTPPEMKFYNVSAYQLMTFLCDADMMACIMPLIPHVVSIKLTGDVQEERDLVDLCKMQYAEINSGGADLVKISEDPRLIPFARMTQYTTRHTIKRVSFENTFPLLENPDGLICYQGSDADKPHLFYVNRLNQTIEEIEPVAKNPEQKIALEQLYASFRAMVDDSARRSSNKEHQLIADTMKHSLQRSGIEYEQCGERYCDNRFDFNHLLNAHRQCRLLALQASAHFYKKDHDEHCKKRNNAWCTLVGHEQRKIMWLLRHLTGPIYNTACSEPTINCTYSPSARRVVGMFDGTQWPLFVGSVLSCELGSNFALMNGQVMRAPLWVDTDREYLDGFINFELAAVCRIIERAKAGVVELTSALDSQSTAAASNLSLGR